MKYYSCLRRLLAWLKPMQIPVFSAYTSFFLILSLFPCMLLLLGILKYTPFGVSELMALAEGLLPQNLLPLAQWLVETSYEHSSGMVISLSAVAALWSASRGMHGLVQGLGAVYGGSRHSGWLRSRAASMVYTFLFLVLLVLTVLVYVGGKNLLDFLMMTTRREIMVLVSLLDLRFWLLLCLQGLLFAAMYAWLPEKRRSFGQCLPGAGAAALAWMLSSELFSVYVTYFTEYTNIFGSLYGLALGMLWLYFCISAVFYGGALNQYIFCKKWK